MDAAGVRKAPRVWPSSITLAIGLLAALGPGPEQFGPYHDAAMQLTQRADVLLHDSQYTREEFPARALFGHSSIDYEVGLAARVP